MRKSKPKIKRYAGGGSSADPNRAEVDPYQKYNDLNTSNNYVKTGTATIGAATQVASAYNSPNKTIGSEYDATGSGVGTIASAINPLVGAAIGISHKIGGIGRSKIEATNPDGSYKNKTAVELNAIGGGLSDPVSGISTYAANGIYTPNEYYNKTQDQNMERVKQQNQMKTYAKGGKHKPKLLQPHFISPQPGSQMYGTAPEFPDGGKYNSNLGEDVAYPKDEQINNPLSVKYHLMPYPINKYKGEDNLDNKKYINMQNRINQEEGITPDEYYKLYPNKVEYDKSNLKDLASHKYNNEFSYGGYNIPSGVYANGGVSNGEPNASIEKQEMTIDPQDGSTYKSDSGTHESGNDDAVNLKPGTQILSDRLKMPGTKKTFAKLGAKYSTTREDKVLENDNISPTKKSSAELAKMVKNQKLQELFNAQESLKNSKMQNYAKRIGIELPQNPSENDEFCLGGTYTNEKGVFARGGRFMGINPAHKGFCTPMTKSTCTPHRKALAMTLKKHHGFHAMGGVQQYPGGGETSYIQYDENGNPITADMQYGQDSKFVDNSIPKYNPPVETNDYLGPEGYGKPSIAGPPFNYNTIGDSISGVANLAGPVYGLTTNKKQPTVNPILANPKYLDSTQALKDERENYLMNKNDIKEIGQGNTGQIIANYIRNKSKSTMDRANILENTQNANVGIYNKADETNIGQRVYAADINRRNEAAYRNMNTKYVGEIGSDVANSYRDNKASSQDQDFLNFLDREYPQVRQKYYNSRNPNNK